LFFLSKYKYYIPKLLSQFITSGDEDVSAKDYFCEPYGI